MKVPEEEEKRLVSLGPMRVQERHMFSMLKLPRQRSLRVDTASDSTRSKKALVENGPSDKQAHGHFNPSKIITIFSRIHLPTRTTVYLFQKTDAAKCFCRPRSASKGHKTTTNNTLATRSTIDSCENSSNPAFSVKNGGKFGSCFAVKTSPVTYSAGGTG